MSANNKFLVSIGVIKGGKKKTITPLGAELAIALQHELPDETAVKWRAVVDATDFLQKVVASVRIRKGMDESSLQSHVAYSAGQPKTPAVATGAGAVVDILKAARLLKEEGGNLVAATPEPPSIPETVEKSLSISESTSDLLLRPSHASDLIGITHFAGVQLTIDVRVQCTPADLDALGQKLRKVIRDLKEPEKGQEDPPSSTANGVSEG